MGRSRFILVIGLILLGTSLAANLLFLSKETQIIPKTHFVHPAPMF